MFFDILIFILCVITLIFIVIFYFISENQTDFYKKENYLLKRNIEECYKYIDFLEKEKKEGHYD